MNVQAQCGNCGFLYLLNFGDNCPQCNSHDKAWARLIPEPPPTCAEQVAKEMQEESPRMFGNGEGDAKGTVGFPTACGAEIYYRPKPRYSWEQHWSVRDWNLMCPMPTAPPAPEPEPHTEPPEVTITEADRISLHGLGVRWD